MQLLLNRLVAFVVEFEASKDMSESQHAEWVGSRARTAVLRALASALTAAPAPGRPAAAADVLRHAAQDAVAGSGTAALLLRWLTLLCADTTVLLTEAAAVHQARPPCAPHQTRKSPATPPSRQA